MPSKIEVHSFGPDRSILSTRTNLVFPRKIWSVSDVMRPQEVLVNFVACSNKNSKTGIFALPETELKDIENREDVRAKIFKPDNLIITLEAGNSFDLFIQPPTSSEIMLFRVSHIPHYNLNFKKSF